MKNVNTTFVAPLALAGLLVSGQAQAGDLSGSLSFDANSHFISYGFDVWGGGESPSGEGTFNPSLSLDYKVNDNWSFSAGFWLDANDNLGDFDVVETDTWIGVAYTSGITQASIKFQNWQYGGTSEEILDLGLSFDTFLSPSITIHKRLGAGASGGYNGTFLVVGAEHSLTGCENFSLTIPVSVAFALDEFHTTESGYGFASIGLQGSYAMTDSSSLNFGVTYYDTDDQVVANIDDSFFTYNAGITFTF